MQTTASRDLYPGPLKEPDFLEKSSPGVERRPVKSRSKSLVLSATLVASSLYFAIPMASASLQSPTSVAVAEGTHVVPEIAEWKRWLETLNAKDLDPVVIENLNAVFTQIVVTTGLIPGGMATPSGVYLLTWDFEEHHLELELFPDHWEWFYKNRKTGRLAGEEDLVTADFSRFRTELVKYSP